MVADAVYPYIEVMALTGEWYASYPLYTQEYWDHINYLTPDIVSNITGDYGISGDKVTNRVAGTGTVKFTLRNDASAVPDWDSTYDPDTDTNTPIPRGAGAYSPGHENCLTDWGKGTRILVIASYGYDENWQGGEDFLLWGGFVESVVPQSNTHGEQRVEVTCTDWMRIAGAHPILTPELIEGGEIGDAVEAVIDTMVDAIQPVDSIINDGFTTYPYIFDMVRANTKALTEFKKLTDSELGWIYIRPPERAEFEAWYDGGNPLDMRGFTEVLVVEGRLTRQGTDTTLISKLKADCGFFLTEASERILAEQQDDVYDFELDEWTEEDINIILDETLSIDFTNKMTNLEASYEDIYNSITTKVYPRVIDAAATTVLATLDTPVAIEAHGSTSDTVFLTLTYRDPSNPNVRVAGKSMVDPVGSTDYQFFLNADGTGTDLTANLIVTATPYANKVDYEIHNTGATAGYVTKLQARGKGIYTYNPVEYTVDDPDSIRENGISALTIDMKYQDEPVAGQVDADVILDFLRNPHLKAKKVYFNANYSSEMMNAFLGYKVGKKISIVETQTGIAGDYFIQKVSFDIALGGIINYSWELTPARIFTATYWILGESELAEETYLG